jgi:triosephosphate isomerase
MHPQRTAIIGGNWKMNTDRASGLALAASVARGVQELHNAGKRVDVAVFPPFVYLPLISEALCAASSRVMLGAQDAYHAERGAFTGEISVLQLQDVGVGTVLAGHSERRHVIHEGDDQINLKVRAILHHGLRCVLCVGEKLEQRETDQTNTVNERQVRLGLRDVRPDELDRLVIAYEPVWAIGTGKVASPEDAQDAHHHIRAVLADLFGKDAAAGVRIQYGGSVTAANAAELLKQPDVDGALVGGASLKEADFMAIVRAAAQ